MSGVLARALAYPFTIPAGSYLYVDGAERPWAPVDETDRRTVLSYGANATVEALRAKLGEGVVPVRAAELSDFDAVYSAHLSPYGAVPAALQRSPGTCVGVFVLSLTPEQLARLHPTEPNYRFARLAGLNLRTDDGALSDVSAYVSRHGCLRVEGSEVAVAALAARGRRFPALAEREVLERVRARVAPGLGLAELVETAVRDPEQSARWTAELRRDARALDWPAHERAAA